MKTVIHSVEFWMSIYLNHLDLVSTAE